VGDEKIEENSTFFVKIVGKDKGEQRGSKKEWDGLGLSVDEAEMTTKFEA